MLSTPERAALIERANAVPAYHAPGVVEVFHYSEDGSIRRFAPHVPQTNPGHPASVWAIDDEHSPIYWFPRHCPRLSVWARDPEQQALLGELFETEASRLCAAETGWLERVRDAHLYRYVFDAAQFHPWADADGQYVSHDAVHPDRVEPIDDVLALHAAADVELRFTPRLGALMDRILASGLPFSFVRIRDAPRLTGRAGRFTGITGGYVRRTMSAVAELLSHTCDTDRGIHRVRRGRGFSYVDHAGTAIGDAETLARIRSLVIPPAWTDVWICLDRNGHIQATGRDAKGRKQYIYHPQWRAHREEVKFADLVVFGERLVNLRRRVDADMRTPGLGLDRVVATTVWLLDNTLIRVGNDEYVRSGDSFGLTTLRDGHAKIAGADLRFRFNGKAGKAHDVVIQNRRVANTVRRCRDLPGQRLLQYVDGDEVRSVGSRDVNAYLGLATTSDFTAKTFRTWGASMIAFGYLRRIDPPTSAREYDRQRNEAVRLASEHLHNTLAVCRRSYVHPAILDDDRDQFDRLLERSKAGNARSSKWMSADERAMLQFLKAADRVRSRTAKRAA